MVSLRCYTMLCHVSDVSDLLTPTEFKLLLLLTLELCNCVDGHQIRFQLILCFAPLPTGFTFLLTALLNCVLWTQ